MAKEVIATIEEPDLASLFSQLLHMTRVNGAIERDYISQSCNRPATK